MNCDETYPLCSVSFAVGLCRSSDGRAGSFEPSTTPHAQKLVEFEEGVFEIAEETTKEDEERRKEIAEEIGETPQKLAPRAVIPVWDADPPAAFVFLPIGLQPQPTSCENADAPSP